MGRVLAKFKVMEITEMLGWNADQPVKRIKLAAVRYGSFFTATPSGTVEMVIADAGAAAQFHVGAEFLVTFEEDVGGTSH